MLARTASLVTFLTVCACQSGTSSSQRPGGGDDAPVNPLTTDDAGLCRGIALAADQAFVADGLCVRAVAVGQGKLRQLTFSSTGELIAVTSDGAVVRYRDANGDGVFSGNGEIRSIARTGGKNGNNAAFDADETYLYAGSPDGVVRFRYSRSVDTLGLGEAVVVGEPMTGTHSLHTVHVYDGYLYVHSGSEGNAAEPASPDYDTERSVIKRFRLADFDGEPFAWSAGEIYYGGVRNMVGFTQNAGDGALYGVVNGLDDLVYRGADVHLDNPGEDLVKLEPGKAHGYPYCFTAQHIAAREGMVRAGTQLASDVRTEPKDPPFQNPHDDAWCAENSTQPLTFFPAHSAPLDLLFVSNAWSLPLEWEGSVLVALHGSWDTTPSVGHQVVRVAPAEDGSMPMPQADAERTTFSHEVIFGGADGDGAWGWASGSDGEYPVRPVGIAISPVDGALYVSSDNAPVLMGVDSSEQGAIYRIALRKP
jgi:glucose/arabinose dehydrogenase